MKTHSERNAKTWLTAALVFGVAAWILIHATSCTPERRHAVLTVLFDGVPPLGTVRDANTGEFVDEWTIERQASEPPPMVRHKPLADGLCDDCHARERSLSLGQNFDQRGRCFSCHEHESFQAELDAYPFLHGPTALSNCLACHNAHESRHPYLVEKPDPELCLDCHERDRVLAISAHAELEGGDETCLPCHDPHGGDDRYFTREPPIDPPIDEDGTLDTPIPNPESAQGTG